MSGATHYHKITRSSTSTGMQIGDIWITGDMHTYRYRNGTFTNQESRDVLAPLQQVSLTTTAGTGEIALQADPDELEKAMVNLISNAIKFTPAGGSVTISSGSKVAHAVGFATPSYFSRLFRKRFGRSPSEYHR